MNLLDALYLPAAVITAPWWARKTRAGWAERLGGTTPLPSPASKRKRILIHAVSVGEVSTLRTLVPRLVEADVEVVISAGTDTGLRRAVELYGSIPGIWIVRYALDFSPAVRRFLDAVRPDAVALVELEVWPNFIAACARRSIPVCVINGRLSARSFRGYSRLRRFFRPVFARLAFAAVQDADYAARFETMGVARERVLITGSMKWDATTVVQPGAPDPSAQRLAAEMGIDSTRPLIVGGSTAPTQDSCEESLLHAACPPGAQLLCAPRRPEHRGAAFAALGGPARCTRRSAPAPAPSGTDRFLLDTIGELRAAYALADVVFVGRTFGDQGGSDPIEPVALGKPVIVGPRYANFEHVVAQFRSAGAIRIADDPAALSRELTVLLADPALRSSMARAGAEVIRAHQGASARHADLILDLVGAGASRATPTP